MDLDLESQYKKYPFELDVFQKKAVEGIEKGEHVLVCAPTGSGKSMVAQHATDWGLRQKKRVIYTTPIKSLSNQAYASLAKVFGADNVGIMTGDNQYNPTAPVLIMTTEILRNFLLDGRTRKHEVETIEEDSDESEESTQYWTMNVAADVAAVVFDEVHYLQDPHRGYVWETCFVHMPPGVQMTMLSATIANPETLVAWLEKTKEHPVKLCIHTKRAVPLTHLLYTNLNPTHKQLPDSTLYSYKKALVDVSEWSVPRLETYLKPVGEHLDWFQRGSTAIEGCVRFLKESDMMPALCFVLSRKRCESICATWSFGLLDKDEVALIHKDWKKVVREACRGDVEMLRKIEGLPQYRLLTESLMKGVAFHHSGVLPVLKECVEMLMKDGRIPCVLATETFAVGINSPTRTVVMTQIDKRTEGGVRCLEPHEYTQMGGRAGRRGLDTVGYVVSLPMGFVRKTSALMYHRMLHGEPVQISSTQVIPSIQVLRALRSKEDEPSTFDTLMKVLGERSMRSYEIEDGNADVDSEKLTLLKLTPDEQTLWDEWVKIHKRPAKTQGQQKKKQKKLNDWFKKIDETLWESAKTKMESNQKIEEECMEKENRNQELFYTLRARLDYLVSIGFIKETSKDEYNLTPAGKSACVIQQGNPCHTAFVLHSLGNINDDTIDPLYLLCFASLFLTPDEKQEAGCELIHRDIIGHICMKTLEESSREWDTKAQIHSCWESSELNYELLQPFNEFREMETVPTYFALQKITGWQEGRLWKTMNDLVSICGEIQEVWGSLGLVGLFKKMGEAQAMAKGATLMIPSLYLQERSKPFQMDPDDE